MKRWFSLGSRFSVCTLLLGVQGFVALPVEAQQKDGDLWEVTTEMSIPGMPAGAQMPGGGPRNVCVKRGDNRPAMADADRCETYDVRRTASTYAWKMRCPGNPATTGSGEITYEGRDRYRGTINMDQGGQAMTMRLVGKRVGECDASAQQAAVQAQVASAQRQSQEAMEQMCAGAIKQMTSHYLKPEAGFNCNAKYKAEFCARLQTPEGFQVVAARRRSPQMPANMPVGDLQEGAAFCGVNGDDLRERLCRRAEQQEQLHFLGEACVGQGGTPGYGAAIATRECAGRTFSSPPAEKYRGFCSAVARAGLMRPAEADAGTRVPAPTKAAEAKPAEPSAAETAVDQGKRLLKGIFGR